MRILVTVCGIVALLGIAIVLWAPKFAVLGTGLIALSLAVALQAALVRAAGRFSNRNSSTDDASSAELDRGDYSDFWAVYEGYERLQVFLARAVGIVAFVYGVVAMNWYFIGLGGALMILFSIWDRIISQSSAPHEIEPPGEPSSRE